MEEEKTTLQIKFPTGESTTIKIRENSDLHKVSIICNKYAKENGLDKKYKIYEQTLYKFSTTYPKLDYDIEGTKGKSIQELKLCKATLLITPKTEKELSLSHEPFNKAVYGDHIGSDLKLKSENRDDREKFEKKLREQELRGKEKEREEKKKAIEKVRNRIQNDQEDRKDMFRPTYKESKEFDDIKD